jgi:hypothetical protein
MRLIVRTLPRCDDWIAYVVDRRAGCLRLADWRASTEPGARMAAEDWIGTYQTIERIRAERRSNDEYRGD